MKNRDKGKQMERCVEHYSKLYSNDNIISESALETIEGLPVMAELDMEPSIEELRNAIKNLESQCGFRAGRSTTDFLCTTASRKMQGT
jgi:hypothetical protein